MAVFDEKVREVLSYCGAVSDSGIKHDLLVVLVKDKAFYRGVDLFKLFYSAPYGDGRPNNEKDACNYLALLPLLQKLYDVASAHNSVHSVRLGGKPCFDDVEKIKKKIESF